MMIENDNYEQTVITVFLFLCWLQLVSQLKDRESRTLRRTLNKSAYRMWLKRFQV